MPRTATCHSTFDGSRLRAFSHAACAWNQGMFAHGCTAGRPARSRSAVVPQRRLAVRARVARLFARQALAASKQVATGRHGDGARDQHLHRGYRRLRGLAGVAAI